MVKEFQRIISTEARKQILEKEGKLPDAVLACVGGGSNAMGMFYEFIKDENVRLIGCEAAGRGVNTGETAATIAVGTEGIFHGMKSYFCQNRQTSFRLHTHSQKVITSSREFPSSCVLTIEL